MMTPNLAKEQALKIPQIVGLLTRKHYSIWQSVRTQKFPGYLLYLIYWKFQNKRTQLRYTRPATCLHCATDKAIYR